MLTYSTATRTAPADLGVRVEGDVGAPDRLMAVLDTPDPDFAIVTP